MQRSQHQQPQSPHMQSSLLLSLPDGVFLANCVVHLSPERLCTLSASCKEANRQSDEWKRALMAREGIRTTATTPIRAVWQSFYCTRVPKDDMPKVAFELTGILQSYVTSECSLRFADAMDFPPTPQILSWRRDRETFLFQALQRSGLMSSEHGRRMTQVFLMESGKMAMAKIERLNYGDGGGGGNNNNNDNDGDNNNNNNPLAAVVAAAATPTTTDTNDDDVNGGQEGAEEEGDNNNDNNNNNINDEYPAEEVLQPAGNAQMRQFVKCIPFIVQEAFTIMAHIVLERFVVDEERGVIGI